MSRGVGTIYGSKNSVREAFSTRLIDSGEIWMRMIESRNRASHTYNQTVANELTELIRTKYFSLFEALEKEMFVKKKNEK